MQSTKKWPDSFSMMRYVWLLALCLLPTIVSANIPKVTVGIDVLLKEPRYSKQIEGKKIALIANQTSVNGCLQSTIDLLKNDKRFKLVALFAPEHGIQGLIKAEVPVEDSKTEDGIPVYSLHGSTKRPTDRMFKDVEAIIFDIQDIGSRSYTYATTLFYVMEEAAKHKIPVIVTDRPNPLGGLLVDGLMLDPKCRSFVGYVNVPYCHGMTIGELAGYFNAEYRVGCNLVVVPMQGWKRSMTFADTGLFWIPTSPQVPEPDTPFFYPATGLLGELQIVNIGVGYTLPFKLVGAPWADANLLAAQLNKLKFPGVCFHPTSYIPFFGSLKGQVCNGVQIVMTDSSKFLPVTTQYLLMGMLKSLYPKRFAQALREKQNRREMFAKVNGTDEVYRILLEEKYAIFQLKEMCQEARQKFLPLRAKYLLRSYAD
jgi:uncharacterized protein YbbC (DUF1343 family)